jgi:hypothetical protein
VIPDRQVGAVVARVLSAEPGDATPVPLRLA